MSGVKGIIGMHRFNICLVVVLLWWENTISLALDVQTAGHTVWTEDLPVKINELNK